MTKNLIVLLAVSGLVFMNSGCTSKKADEPATTVENADVEKIDDASLSSAAQATDPSLEAALGGETTTTSTTTTTTTTADAPPPVTPPAETAPVPTIDDSSLNNGGAVTDLGAGGTTTETTTMTTKEGSAPPVVETNTTVTSTETASPMDMGSGELTETPITDPSVVASTINEQHSTHTKTSRKRVHHETSTQVAATPVTTSKAVGAASAGGMRKIGDTMPYQTKDGAWINTVYIVHPKEKLVDISMKIFGSDKSADLKKIAENSYLKSRPVRAGDKIFYTSPNRPDDATKTMLYYEDMGMVPETYVAKKGESLKKVSKTLLGYDNAWKEMWVSNGIESKTELKDGETLRYWKDTGAVAAATPPPSSGGATLIDSSQAPPATATASAPPPPTEASPTAQATPPPTPPPASGAALPPPPADANANLPPPPPTDPNAPAVAAAPEAGLPPPPPAPDVAPPPPPPPEATAGAEAPAAPPVAKKKVNLDEEAASEEGGGMDSQTMMSIGALAVLVALLAVVIIRKKRQKAAAAQMVNNEINV